MSAVIVCNFRCWRQYGLHVSLIFVCSAWNLISTCLYFSVMLEKSKSIALWFADEKLEVSYRQKEIQRCGLNMCAMELVLVVNFITYLCVYNMWVRLLIRHVDAINTGCYAEFQYPKAFAMLPGDMQRRSGHWWIALKSIYKYIKNPDTTQNISDTQNHWYIVYMDSSRCEQTGHHCRVWFSAYRNRKAVQNALHIIYKPSLLTAWCNAQLKRPPTV